MSIQSAYDVLDQGLARLGPNGVAVRGRLIPNHAPMVVEALCALGAGASALAFADRARPHILPIRPGTRTIGDDDWEKALGNGSIADWLEFFRRAVERAPWQGVVATWVPRFVLGIEAGGTHALIRTAHAARALSVTTTDARMAELCKALAYWAAEFDPLPGRPTLGGQLPMEEASRAVPRVDHAAPRVGAPREFVHVVRALEGFTSAVDAARGPDDPERALEEILELGLRLYLANADTQPLVCLHAITAPAAMQLLIPFLDVGDRTSAVAHTWQAVAAFIATYVQRFDAPLAFERPMPSAEDLVAQAASSDDPHVIKLTEACVRQAERGHRNFLLAADDWMRRVEVARGWTAEQKRSVGLHFG